MITHKAFMKLFPRDIESEIGEIEAHCKSLRAAIAKARKQHRRIRMDNNLFSPIAYHTFQIAIHNDIIRAGLNKIEQKSPTILCNGTQLTW